MTRRSRGGDSQSQLNPEPTEEQRDRWRWHKARGTSPGNPKWYKPALFPKYAEFKAGLPARFPAWVTNTGPEHLKLRYGA